jgi:hypothetical protein
MCPLTVAGREDENAGRGGRGEPAGRLDSIYSGHADVHERHVGPGAQGELDGLLTGGGLAGDGEAGRRGEDPAQSGTVRVPKTASTACDLHVLENS